MKFRRRPTEVDAVEVTHEFLVARYTDPEKQFEVYQTSAGVHRSIDYFASGVSVETRRGTVFARLGDYIVTHPNGEKGVYMKDAFEEHFERVEELKHAVRVDISIRTPELDAKGLRMGAMRQITMSNDPDLLSMVVSREAQQAARWLSMRFGQYVHGEINPETPESEVPPIQDDPQTTLLERVLEQLKKVEWGDYNHRFDVMCCPECASTEAEKHMSNCSLHALIQEVEKAIQDNGPIVRTFKGEENEPGRS